MDTLMILIIIFIPLLAQIGVKSTYSKYLDIKNSCNITGKDVARRILDKNGLNNVQIICIKGSLSDNYDPRTKTVSLSEDIYSSSTVAAMAVSAHEIGHAIQDKEGYSFMRFRSAMVPVVNLTSRVSTIFIIIGIFSEFANLYYLGIILLLVGLLFQLVTLPVEFNASSRARKELESLNIVNQEDSHGTKKMLNAAAFTYVASFIAMTAQVLRLIGLSRRN